MLLNKTEDISLLRERLKTARSRRLKDNHTYRDDGFSLLHPQQEGQYISDRTAITDDRQVMADQNMKRPTGDRTRV